jgi:hypothetical protein
VRRAVEAMARHLRHQHFAGDGCLEDDRPLMRLGGAALISPGNGAEYPLGCARLGVPVRDEGWALWYTWDGKGRPHTLVTTALDTTRGLLDNWSRGRDVHPAWPLRAQVSAVVRGWPGPIVLSPARIAEIGLADRPDEPSPGAGSAGGEPTRR